MKVSLSQLDCSILSRINRFEANFAKPLLLSRFLPALYAVAIAATSFTAQAGVVFSNVFDFGLTNYAGYSNASTPEAGLVLGTNGNLYGTTFYGGTNGAGTIFELSLGGTLSILYSFSNGARPSGVLMQASDGNFYGAIQPGTNYPDGAIFQFNPSGGLTILHSFNYSVDGESPSPVIQATDGNLYGTTGTGALGGGNGGTVFKITTNGVLTTIYSFTNGSDGSGPNGGVVQGSDGFFYGTTQSGGSNYFGTIFKLDSSGNITTLHSFSGRNDGALANGAPLQASDGYFYGTTSGAGSNSTGTIFKFDANGDFTNLCAIPANLETPFGPPSSCGLIQGSDGNIYGALYPGSLQGGGVFESGGGGVFEMTTNGLLTILHYFQNDTDGYFPNTPLVQLSNGDLYGTYTSGPLDGDGGVFKFYIGTEPISEIPFNVSPSQGPAPLTVRFSTFDMDKSGDPVVAWNWNFGDGSTGTVPLMTHTYTNSGIFTATLTATTSLGGSVPGQSSTATIYVGSPPVLLPSIASQNGLILTCSNGLAGAPYILLTTTNLALPMSQWTPVATNSLTTNGSFSITNTGGTGSSQAFYMLQTQ